MITHWGIDVKEIRRLLMGACSHASHLWPDIDARVASEVAPIVGANENHPLDITSFAIYISKPRTTALRHLKSWESLGYVTIERKNVRTIVMFTEKMKCKSRKYLQYFDDRIEHIN